MDVLERLAIMLDDCRIFTLEAMANLYDWQTGETVYQLNAEVDVMLTQIACSGEARTGHGEYAAESRARVAKVIAAHHRRVDEFNRLDRETYELATWARNQLNDYTPTETRAGMMLGSDVTMNQCLTDQTLRETMARP